MIFPRCLAVAFVAALALLSPGTLHADSNTTVLQVLNNADVYIADAVYQHRDARAGDLQRLKSSADAAYNQGVPVKVALLEQFPSNIHTAAQAADNIRNFEDFSGVVIVVWPRGIGLSSDMMTSSELATVVRKTEPLCSGAFTACALAAVHDTIPFVKSEQSSAYRDAAIFWVVTLAVVAVLVAAMVLYFRRRTSRTLARMREYAGDSGHLEGPSVNLEAPPRIEVGGLPEANQHPPGLGG